MLKLAGFACARPHSIIGVCLLTLVLALLGTRGLEVNADTRAYFSETNHHLNVLRAFDKTYRPNNNILFLIDTHGRDVFDPEVVATIHALTEEAWGLPHAIQVDSLSNFPHTYSIDDDFILEDLIPESDTLSPEQVERRRSLATQDPLLRNRLISEDAKTTAVNVNFNLPDRGSSAVKEINAAAEDLVTKIEAAHPGMDILTTGNVVLMRAFTDAALNDVLTLLPLSGLAIALIVFLILRSFRETMAVVGCVVATALIAVGLGAWSGLQVDQSTAVAPIIIMTLAMASALHVMTFARRLAAEEKTSEDALKHSLAHNLAPVFLTSLTTFIGFLAFNFADAPPFQDLGNLVATGIVINFFATFTLLPALVKLAGVQPHPPSIAGLTSLVSRLTVRNAKAFVILGPLFVMVASLGITRINLDDDFIRYFGPDYDYRVASDFAEDKLTGLNIVEFSVPAGKEDEVYAPEYQRRLSDFVTWLNDQDKVVSAISIVDITRKIDTSLNQASEGAWEVPDDRQLIAQYFLLYEMSLPFGKDITDQINVDRSESRVNVILRNATSSEIRLLKSAAEQWLVQNSPPDLTSEGTSINVLFAYLSVVNIQMMLKGTFYSFLVISVIIGFALRKASYGFVSLITNMLPAFAGFGIWGLAFGQLNLAASVITAMTLGIVVDDTIHYLLNYKRHRESGKSATEAAEMTTKSVGTALLVTTISLSIGFLLLSLSDFQVNQTLGIFTALILIIAVVIDLLILPSALIRFDDRLHKNVQK